MKPAAVIFSSLILRGFFLTDVLSVKCGVNMYAQNCVPCNPICNRPAINCLETCGCENDQCKCEIGYYLPIYNSTHCVPLDDCPSPSKTKI